MGSSDDILAALLDECYERLRAGESLSACLQRYPEHAQALAPLLETITQVSRLRPVPERPREMAAQTRAQFLANARRLRASQPVASLRERLAAGWAAFLASFSRPRALPAGMWVALLAVVLVGVLATGVITASAKALPGDPLYPVKTATEQARILLARDPATRAALLEQFGQERLREAKAVVEQQRPVSSLVLDGVIEAIEGNQWRVSGLTLLITPETIIEGYPAVGARVHGTVRAPGDRTLVALHVEVAQAAPSVPSPTLPPPSPTPSPAPTATATPQPAVPSSRMVSGWPVHTATMPTEPPTATATVTPTATATATATATPTATITPTPSPTWARPEVKKRLLGWVTRIEGSRWTIGDVTVETNGDTRFYGNPGVGSYVDAILLVQPDGSYLALEIRARGTQEATPEPIEFTGQIKAINGELWTIGSLVVRVTGQTQIEGEPEVGSWVQCKAERRAGGEIWALRIKVLILAEYEFQGVIESVSGNVWRIAGQSLLITERTQIIGEVAVGREAQVRAVRHPDGELEALLIYVLPEEETPTPTSTSTLTATSTKTAGASPTPTSTPPMEPVATPTATPTATRVESATPSVTTAPTSTSTATPGSTPTATRVDTATPSATTAPTNTPTATPGLGEPQPTPATATPTIPVAETPVAVPTATEQPDATPTRSPAMKTPVLPEPTRSLISDPLRR